MAEKGARPKLDRGGDAAFAPQSSDQDDLPGKLSVRSVSRAIDILICLAEGPLPLSTVALRTSLSKGTSHRLLTTLGHGQLVVQDPVNGLYLLGPGCVRFTDAMRSGLGGVGPLARPVLIELRDATGETVTLHVRVGDQRVCVEEIPSPQPVRYTAGIGSSDPIHIGAAGKMLLAGMDEASRRVLLRSLDLDGAGAQQPGRDHSALVKELDAIRKRGWAESRGERVVGAAAVSAPVHDADGRSVAVVSILGPDSRMTEARLRSLRETVSKAADRISRRIEALDETPGLDE